MSYSSNFLQNAQRISTSTVDYISFSVMHRYKKKSKKNGMIEKISVWLQQCLHEVKEDILYSLCQPLHANTPDFKTEFQPLLAELVLTPQYLASFCRQSRRCFFSASLASESTGDGSVGWRSIGMMWLKSMVLTSSFLSGSLIKTHVSSVKSQLRLLTGYWKNEY